jgi:hypothetical protein
MIYHVGDNCEVQMKMESLVLLEHNAFCKVILTDGTEHEATWSVDHKLFFFYATSDERGPIPPGDIAEWELVEM